MRQNRLMVDDYGGYNLSDIYARISDGVFAVAQPWIARTNAPTIGKKYVFIARSLMDGMNGSGHAN